VAAVWSGPSIEGIIWRNDQAVADLVTKLAARRTPLDDAGPAIEDFARSQGAGKTKKLTAVFAGLFEMLDYERTQVIEGLLRFGAKQKALAAKYAPRTPCREKRPVRIRRMRAGKMRSLSSATWNGTCVFFDERHQSLIYVCETPTLIEQRLFALAKVIQSKLDMTGRYRA